MEVEIGQTWSADEDLVIWWKVPEQLLKWNLLWELLKVQDLEWTFNLITQKVYISYQITQFPAFILKATLEVLTFRKTHLDEEVLIIILYINITALNYIEPGKT